MRIVPCSTFEGFMNAMGQLSPGEETLLVNQSHGHLDDFRRGVAEAEGFLTDVDGSVFAGNEWKLARDVMTAPLREADLADLQAYASGGERTDVDDIGFIFRSIARLQESHFSRGALRALAKQPAREGAEGLIRSFGEGGGDMVCAVSYGMYDWIDGWFDHMLGQDHKVAIMALRLRWSGRWLIGFDPATVVTDGNKGYMANVWRATCGLRAGRTMALVDSPTDLKMLHPEYVSVLIVPPNDPEAWRQKHRNDGFGLLWPRVSAVLVSDSLQSLVEMRQAR